MSSSRVIAGGLVMGLMAAVASPVAASSKSMQADGTLSISTYRHGGGLPGQVIPLERSVDPSGYLRIKKLGQSPKFVRQLDWNHSQYVLKVKPGTYQVWDSCARRQTVKVHSHATSTVKLVCTVR